MGGEDMSFFTEYRQVLRYFFFYGSATKSKPEFSLLPHHPRFRLSKTGVRVGVEILN